MARRFIHVESDQVQVPAVKKQYGPVAPSTSAIKSMHPSSIGFFAFALVALFYKN